jgi:hypothetical protein
MEHFLCLVLIVLASSLAAGIALVIMVKKYYWGPTGVPPKQRYKQEKSNESKNALLSEPNKK